MTLILISCKVKQAGFIPMHHDEFIETTAERSFELENSLTGDLIRYQPSYDCTNDTITYNSTYIIKLVNEDTITVYSPCDQQKLKLGAMLTIEKAKLDIGFIQQSKREIVQQFPKKHPNYPYWECISCKFPNTVGIVTAL
ncbi:hypothetical protein [Reichenbachiella sp.]|uniref:hypothetical protein n=1 Tax=Reichenbachiella sp. TaxID=2184521 RepID=UPI003BAEDEC3